jgi:hypothetical protein
VFSGRLCEATTGHTHTVTTSSGACRAARATDSRSRLPAGVSALLEPGGIGRPNTSSMVITNMNYHFVNMLLRLRNLALDSSKAKTKVQFM